MLINLFGDMNVTTDKVIAHRVWVYLAEHEYAGSTRMLDGSWKYVDEGGRPIDNMREAAREVFEANPDLENLVVTVCEHGGWSLSYTRDWTCVGTANDMAIMSPQCHDFWSKVRDAEWVYLREIRRPNYSRAQVA